VKTSRNGRILVACFEALVLHAYIDGEYADGRPKWSKGFGVGGAAENEVITVEEAFRLFAAAIASREYDVSRRIRVPVEQHQYDALFSFYYQSGNRRGWVAAIAALLNEGRINAAGDCFLSGVVNEKGIFQDGLKRRREREQKLFLTGDYGDLSTIKAWERKPKRGDPPDYLYQVKPEDFA
jgi:lysozyme